MKAKFHTEQRKTRRGSSYGGYRWKIVTATYENAVLYVITEHAYTHEADRLLRKETT